MNHLTVFEFLMRGKAGYVKYLRCIGAQQQADSTFLTFPKQLPVQTDELLNTGRIVLRTGLQIALASGSVFASQFDLPYLFFNVKLPILIIPELCF